MGTRNCTGVIVLYCNQCKPYARAHAVVYVTAEIFKKKGEKKTNMPLPKFSLQFAFSWIVYFSNRTESSLIFGRSRPWSARQCIYSYTFAVVISCLMFLCLVMCSVRLITCFRFVYDIFYVPVSCCPRLPCVSSFPFVSLLCDWLFVHIFQSSLFTCTQYAFILYSSHFSFHMGVLTSNPGVRIKEKHSQEPIVLCHSCESRVFRLTA